MQIISTDETILHKNDENCTVQEYPTSLAIIDGAIAHIQGRYPSKGYVMNEISHEIAYVVDGQGNVLTEHESRSLRQGDEILIPPGEYFAWNGNLTLFIACTPRFDPKQYKSKE